MKLRDYLTELFKSDVGVHVHPQRRKKKVKEPASKTFKTSWFLDVGGKKNAEYFFEATYHNITALPSLPKGYYNVSFGIQYAPEEFRDKISDQFDLTGLGNATKVLSGVVSSFKSFVKRTNPEVFIYSAEKGSRVRLYDRFAKIIEKESGYKYERRPSRFRDMDFDWIFYNV